MHKKFKNNIMAIYFYKNYLESFEIMHISPHNSWEPIYQIRDQTHIGEEEIIGNEFHAKGFLIVVYETRHDWNGHENCP